MNAGDNDDMKIGELLAEQLDRLFAARVSHQSLTRAEQGEFDKALWNEIEQLGAIGALAPENAGGAGLAWAQCGAIFQKIGEHAAPLPLAEAMLATWALGCAGLAAPDTQLTLSDVIFDIDDAGKLQGVDPLCAWLPHATHVVALARANSAMRLCVMRSADVQWEPQATIARVPGAKLIAKNVVAKTNVAAPAGFGELGLKPALAAARAAAMAGAMTTMLALTIDYANTRSQFGKTLGRFQAIQHLLAEFAELTAAAQVAADYACRQFDGDVAAAERGAAIAKIRAGHSATRAAAIAHQIFGAIGITDEHSLHFHSRRLWQWRGEAGSEHAWAEWLGRQVLAAGGEALWSGIVKSPL